MSAPPFHITALELGPMNNFIYLIQDLSTQRTAVIDPAWDVQKIRQVAAKHSMHITDILLTHSHHDHINGVHELLDHCDAQLHILKAEAQFWGENLDKPSLHHGGDHIRLGKTDIQILHTPGHTPGSACYLVDEHVLTGDTLFVFGCGRCDLTGGDPEVMHQTLGKLQTTLPQHTRVHPGHNYGQTPDSTMAEQIAGNPFLQIADLNTFIHYRMDQHDHVRDSPYGAETRAHTLAQCQHASTPTKGT